MKRLRADIRRIERGFRMIRAQYRVAVSVSDSVEPTANGNTWQARAAIKSGELMIEYVRGTERDAIDCMNRLCAELVEAR